MLQAFVVTALQMFSLDAVNASEFLEVYKGVVAPGEFQGMLDELTSGLHVILLCPAPFKLLSRCLPGKHTLALHAPTPG